MSWLAHLWKWLVSFITTYDRSFRTYSGHDPKDIWLHHRHKSRWGDKIERRVERVKEGSRRG